MIGCLGPMVGTVVVAVNPPGPSAQMAIAEAAGPCPEDTAFCRERNPPMPTRGDNGPKKAEWPWPRSCGHAPRSTRAAVAGAAASSARVGWAMSAVVEVPLPPSAGAGVKKDINKTQP